MITQSTFAILFDFKKLIFFLLCFEFTSHQSFAQWQWLNPKPSGFANNDVVFVNNETGYILSSNGDLFKTTNLGNEWKIYNNFPNAICLNIKYTTGVIAGHLGTLYVSSDSGISWKKIVTGISDAFSFINIVSRDTFFLSTSHEYNTNGYIYMTTNRGKTFVKRQCNIPIFSVSFVNSKIGFVGGTLSNILKTEDGGLTWILKRQSSTYPSTILSMQFLDKDTGYAFQEYYTLLRTNDGGNTWTESNANARMNAMNFLNTQDGYMGGEYGAIYATHDGGKTLEYVGFDGFKDGNDIYSIYFLSKDTGFAVGLLGRIIKTTNSCATWTPYSPTYSFINGVSFGSSSVGYAANGKYIYKTIDKGETWNQLEFNAGLDYTDYSVFRQIYFYQQDSGFVISDLPVQIHETTNGGVTWDTITPTWPYGYDSYYDLQFINSKTAFLAVGATGNAAILETKDAGYTWKYVWQAQYFGEYFNRIFYLNEDTGYAIRGSSLYKTTNGSKDWTVVYTSNGYYPNLRAIYFTSDKTGFIADEGNNIISTKDGGNTWGDIITLPYTSSGINTIKFYNAQSGFLTGGNDFGPTDYGFIYETVDSGKSWQLSESLGGKSISFTPDTSVIVAGFGGTILSSKIKGQILALNELVLTTVNTSNSGVLLLWKTENDLNSNYFIVERSADGINFKSIAKISSYKNNGLLTTYKYNDTSTSKASEGKLYYRIKKIDDDGSVMYSNIKVINIQANRYELRIIPNPSNGHAVLYFDMPITNGKIFIWNDQGKQVFAASLNEQTVSSYSLEKSGLAAGIYTIQVVAPSKSYFGRLIVQ